jgi:DNA-binding NtrC family response regulator
MSKRRILIVDHQPAVRFDVRDFLERHGYDVNEAASCASAETAFRAARPDAVVLDYALPDGDALKLMPRLRTIDPAIPIVILTAHGSIELAVRAVKEGADHFLSKPVELATLLVIVRRVLQTRRDRRTALARRVQDARSDVDPFLGTSSVIRRLAAEAERLLDSNSPVLIHGATGTGKGMLARWLHSGSPRAEDAFVDLNCAALNREFLEPELFGYEKGAFTGAVRSKAGLLEIGDRGTVFLDEIGDLHAEVQPKLLKVLEEKRFRRMGEARERVVDIRLIAATHRDLSAVVRDQKFRADLYFRICTFPLRVPSLSERKEDIPLLAERIVAKLTNEVGRPLLQLSPAAEEALKNHHWPGNIRELRNVLERAVLFHRSDRIEPTDLRLEGALVADDHGNEAWLTLEEVERRHIERVLQAERGNVRRAAARLGLPRSSLYQKISRFGIRLAERSGERALP